MMKIIKQLLTIVLIFYIAIILSCSRKKQYGLQSSEGDFIYSYYLTDSELFIKNREDFNRQFETAEFKKLEKAAKDIEEKKGLYMQPEILFLPVVQKVVSGNKYVFIFETEKKEMDGVLVKRIACECDELKDRIEFPTECVGYYMVDDWEWPPKIFKIVKGEINFKYISLVTGHLAGNINIVIDDDIFSEKEKIISGDFNVADKNKTLFFSMPARIN